MDNSKVNKVLAEYARTLRTLDAEPVRQGNQRSLVLDIAHHKERMTIKCHLLWMCETAIEMTEDRLAKKMRWLGFVQCGMWMLGIHSIEQLKEHSMPQGEEFHVG